jgi:hypothetical protein
MEFLGKNVKVGTSQSTLVSTTPPLVSIISLIQANSIRMKDVVYLTQEEKTPSPINGTQI